MLKIWQQLYFPKEQSNFWSISFINLPRNFLALSSTLIKQGRESEVLYQGKLLSSSLPPGRSGYTPCLFLNNFLLHSSHSLNDQQFFSCSPTTSIPSLSFMTSQLSFVPLLSISCTNFYILLNNLYCLK